MGNCKNNMTAKTKKGTSLIKKVKNRLCKNDDVQETAETFVDTLAILDDKLGDLIKTKESDLDKEKGQEVTNEKKLAKLKTVQYHLDAIVILADEYQSM